MPEVPVTELANQPDGAKPGSDPLPNSSLSFNADERAEKREQAPITLGGVTYTRCRKNWTLTRNLRRLLRKQERTSIQQDRLNKQLEDLPLDAPDDQLDRIEKEVDEAQDQGDVAAYEIIALLLKDEDDSHPDLDALKDELDVEDAGTLAMVLATGREPDPMTANEST